MEEVSIFHPLVQEGGIAMTIKGIGSFAVSAVVLLGLSGPASAVPFVVGDVFASIGSGQVQQYSSTGVLKDTLNTTVGGFTTGSAFDATGNFYVTNFGGGSISKFAGPGDPHTVSTFASGINASPESIVFDAAGNMYVGVADGDRDVRKYSSTGTLLATYNVATTSRGSDWIDLAADQKTLYYTSEGNTIKRFDVSTNTQLADFANLPGRPAFALRILADGTVLVADSAAVYRVDSTSAVLNTYDVAGNNNWFALNLDPNGTSFWSGDFGTGQLVKFNIATGAVELTIATGSSSLFGVSVYGEITQGGGGNAPEPGTLALLGLGLAGLAAARRRMR
jgi:hypothetical protein